MFINRKDLLILEEKIRQEYKEYFDGKIVEINNYIQETLKNLESKPRQKNKKVVD